jgi:hypothetical protein
MEEGEGRRMDGGWRREGGRPGETEKAGTTVCGAAFSRNERWLVTVDVYVGRREEGGGKREEGRGRREEGGRETRGDGGGRDHGLWSCLLQEGEETEQAGTKTRGLTFHSGGSSPFPSTISNFGNSLIFPTYSARERSCPTKV